MLRVTPSLLLSPQKVFIYRGIAGNAPETAPQTYLQVAIIAAVILTMLAFLFFRRAVVEMTGFHVTYVIGFGWLMPVLLRT